MNRQQLTGAVTVRAQTSQLVTSVSIQNGEAHQDVLARIYARLQYHYGVDLSAFPRSKGEDLLTIAERFDHIDKVYGFALADLFQTEKEVSHE